MCIILGEEQIDTVAGTRIFARGDGHLQYLVYSMSITTRVDACMILPLPVPAGSSEDAVEFINLENYPEFFTDLQSCMAAAMSEFEVGGFADEDELQPLAVHDVGSFIASFVPTMADFERLDPAFRGEPGLWNSMPQYADWGFAVFQLKTTVELTPRGDPELDWMTQEIHPMAFRFQRRDTGQLYFPTVHVHDGKWHDQANFDHQLYVQGKIDTRDRIEALNEAEIQDQMNVQREDHLQKGKNWNDTIEGYYRRDFQSSWEHTTGSISPPMDIARSQGIVAEDQGLFRCTIAGIRANSDFWI